MRKVKTYSPEAYDVDELYDKPYEDTTEERLELKRDKSIKRIRVKTIKSGNMLECEIFPVWDTKTALGRAPKAKESRQTQRNLNRKNAVKTAIRLINANFTKEDIYATVTYDDENMPDTVEEAEAEVYKYIRRLNRKAAKLGYPPLKFFYVTHKGKISGRIDHHIIINFRDRDILEQMWHGGARKNAKRLQPDKFGYEGVVRYMLERAQGKKRYTCSRNLDKPIITRADSKITRGGVEKILRGFYDVKTLFERMYKDYDFSDLNAFTSDYVSGAYVYVRMRRRE